MLIQAINVLGGTMIVLAVWQLALQLGGSRQLARRAAWMAAAFPTLIIYSALTLREVAVAYPLLLGILYFARWYRTRRLLHLVLGGAALVLSLSFHSGAFVAIAIAALWLAVRSVRSLARGSGKHVGARVAALVLAVALLGAIGGTGWGLDKLGGKPEINPDEIAARQEIYGHGRTQYLEGREVRTYLDLVWQTPVRVAYFLFAPFPWMASQLIDLFGVLDSFFYLWLSYLLYRSRRCIRQNAMAVMVLAVFLGMVFVFATGVSNYGTAMRHRAKMLPILIALTGLTPVMGRQRRRRLERAGAQTRFQGVPPPGLARGDSRGAMLSTSGGVDS